METTIFSQMFKSIFLDPNAVVSAAKTAPTEDSIREKAYALWEEAGRPEGDGVEFWIEAERQLATS